MTEKSIFPPVSSDAIAWEEYSHGAKFGSRFKHLTEAVMGKERQWHVGVAGFIMMMGAA